MKKITTIDYTSILMFAKEWVRKQYRPFSANELRKSYYDAGNKEPENKNVYGMVFRSLSKDNLIIHIGYSKSTNPVAKGRVLMTWISREYSEKQKHNRSIAEKHNLKLEL